MSSSMIWVGLGLIAIVLLIAYIKKQMGDEKGMKGTVHNVEHTQTVLGKQITTFEIHMERGIFYAGFVGHAWDIHEGQMIEFWPSSDQVTNTTIPRLKENADGTTTRWADKLYYYALRKYRTAKHVLETED